MGREQFLKYYQCIVIFSGEGLVSVETLGLECSEHSSFTMSGDLLLGTFGDLSKVKHQIEATLNNNGVATKYEKLQDETEEVAPLLPDQKQSEEQLKKKEVAESLHKLKKGERAKMLADGYTTGKEIH